MHRKLFGLISNQGECLLNWQGWQGIIELRTPKDSRKVAFSRPTAKEVDLWVVFLGRQHKSELHKCTAMDFLPSDAEASGHKHVNPGAQELQHYVETSEN